MSKFKKGDLVAPTINYNGIKKVTFSPFIPNQNTICTVDVCTEQTLELEEVKIKEYFFHFDPAYWALVQPKEEQLSSQEIEELTQELVNA